MLACLAEFRSRERSDSAVGQLDLDRLEVHTVKRQRRRTGDFIIIRLDTSRFALGRVLEEPYVGFYDLELTSREVSLVDVDDARILFKLAVMNNTITAGRWEVVGNRSLSEDLSVLPRLFRQDPISGELFIVEGEKEWPANREEVATLERAAVWSAEHVEDRLRDHFAGKPNVWVESLRPR